MLSTLLQHPQIYQGFQRAGGFFGARVRLIRRHLRLKAGEHVIDIGCGPGFILDHLPRGIRYHGVDIDTRYINYAQSHFGSKGFFHCGQFEPALAARIGPADAVMMNGLLHHLSNEEAASLLHIAHSAMKPGARLFTLDGCFLDGQSRIARWLLRHDRGRFVRTEHGYRQLLINEFGAAQTYIHEAASICPYTFVVGLAAVPAEATPGQLVVRVS